MRKVLFLFGSLTDGDVDWLADIGRHREVAPGRQLIRQGQPVDEVYLLLAGMLGVRLGSEPALELARLHPGEIAGELSFLDSRAPNATVAALEPSRVLAIPRAELQRRLDADEGFAARFYRALGLFLASRLRQTVSRLGYGEPEKLAADPDEMDPMLLEQTALAAIRFEQLLGRLTEP